VRRGGRGEGENIPRISRRKLYSNDIRLVFVCRKVLAQKKQKE
jgi:hypothetical protein